LVAGRIVVGLVVLGWVEIPVVGCKADSFLVVLAGRIVLELVVVRIVVPALVVVHIVDLGLVVAFPAVRIVVLELVVVRIVVPALVVVHIVGLGWVDRIVVLAFQFQEVALGVPVVDFVVGREPWCDGETFQKLSSF